MSLSDKWFLKSYLGTEKLKWGGGKHKTSCNDEGNQSLDEIVVHI